MNNRQQAEDGHAEGFNTVLFICTGNYYRSRFAEAVFNHHAQALGLKWRAISRGLATYLVRDHLSQETKRALKERGIDLDNTADRCIQLDERDLERAVIWVGLDEAEHRPMMAEVFPLWADKIEYWQISDLRDAPAHAVLPTLEAHVIKLVESCHSGHVLDADHRKATR